MIDKLVRGPTLAVCQPCSTPSHVESTLLARQICTSGQNAKGSGTELIVSPTAMEEKASSDPAAYAPRERAQEPKFRRSNLRPLIHRLLDFRA
jgi:hypothetical protein